MITPETQIKRSETILYTDLTDEIVMMDIEKGQYYGIYEVGMDIWTLLEQPRTAAAISQSLLREYRVSPEVCIEEVLRFLGQLQEQGIVEVVA
jgi:hypothetical protein